jgi:hypothetical protein
MSLIFVDCEASGPAPCVAFMTEFGAVEYESGLTFHGFDDTKETMLAFCDWLDQFDRPIFVSDNPAFDWQWINDAFWKHGVTNPFGHSARRISDFYAGCRRDFRKTMQWKAWRKTPHDHNPVHDAQGNVEAFREILRRYPKLKEDMV